MARKYRRNRLGQFARNAGTKVATNRPRYVSGSLSRSLEIGRGGEFAGVKAGAEFKTPAGRGVLVKGIVGYHGKPDRLVTVEPSLNKPKRTLTVTARPNPNRAKAQSARKAAGTKVGASTRSGGRKPAPGSSGAGKRVRK